VRDTAIETSSTIGAESVERWCVDYIGRTLNMPPDEIDPNGEFDSLGLDSAIVTAMILDLEEWLGIEIPPSVIFEQTTIGNMAVSLAQRLATSARGNGA
jgi:acyl carrier protein